MAKNTQIAWVLFWIAKVFGILSAGLSFLGNFSNLSGLLLLLAFGCIFASITISLRQWNVELKTQTTEE